MIIVHVPGQPVAKARPRMTRSGHVYTPAPSRKYEAMARQCAVLAMRGRERLEGAVHVGVTVILPVRPSWPAAKRAAALSGDVHPTARPDLDNYIKAALDACNAVLWADDCQVVSLAARKFYGLEPALHITAEEVNR